VFAAAWIKMVFDLGSNYVRAWDGHSEAKIGMFGARWIVGLAALLLAAMALYLLLMGKQEPELASMPEMSRPALDQIDAESRSAMRALLRETENEE
jgi:hypothetical protein